MQDTNTAERGASDLDTDPLLSGNSTHTNMDGSSHKSRHEPFLTRSQELTVGRSDNFSCCC